MFSLTNGLSLSLYSDTNNPTLLEPSFNTKFLLCGPVEHKKILRHCYLCSNTSLWLGVSCYSFWFAFVNVLRQLCLFIWLSRSNTDTLTATTEELFSKIIKSSLINLQILLGLRLDRYVLDKHSWVWKTEGFLRRCRVAWVLEYPDIPFKASVGHLEAFEVIDGLINWSKS